MLSHAARVGGRFVSRFAPRGVAPRSLPCRAAPRGFASQAETSSQVWGRTGAALAFSAAGGIAYLASAPAAEAKSTVHPSSVPIQGIPGTTYERTYLMIKPDGVQRGLINEIIRRWEQRGFTLVAMKLVVPTRAVAEAHYEDLSARPFYKDLVTYISSHGPVVAMVWQGKDVIRTSRQMIGKTDPLVSDPGTVRADLAVFVGRNVIHGSDGAEGAAAEIPLWFRPADIVPVDSKSNPWLYDDRA